MPDPSIRKRRGQTGESHARAWLEGHGYRRVASNWHCRSGELDLVMIDGTELVFVEVKTRTASGLGGLRRRSHGTSGGRSQSQLSGSSPPVLHVRT